jgi:hypothetical protein
MMNKVSNDKYAQIAQDALYEAGWEMTPRQAQESLEQLARIHIDLWLKTGRTDQFK